MCVSERAGEGWTEAKESWFDLVGRETVGGAAFSVVFVGFRKQAEDSTEKRRQNESLQMLCWSCWIRDEGARSIGRVQKKKGASKGKKE